MKKFKKNKNIFFGLIGLSLISLASIGFSTWVISIDEHENLFTVDISIETIYNGTIIASTSTTTTSITLDSSSVSSEGSVVGGVGSQVNMDVPLSIDIIVADDEVNKIENVTFDLSVKNEENDNNKVNIETNDLFNRAKREYSYLSLSVLEEEINALDFTDYDVEGFKKLDLDIDDFKITYGDYFAIDDINYTPEEFYNKKLESFKTTYQNNKSKENLDNYLKAIKQAEDELNTMQNDLNNKTLTISVSVNSSSN